MKKKVEYIFCCGSENEIIDELDMNINKIKENIKNNFLTNEDGKRIYKCLVNLDKIREQVEAIKKEVERELNVNKIERKWS